MELKDKIFICAEVHPVIQYKGSECPLCFELKRNDFLREKVRKLNQIIDKQNIKLQKKLKEIIE